MFFQWIKKNIIKYIYFGPTLMVLYYKTNSKEFSY